MRKNLFLLTLFAILAFYTTSCGGKADKPQDAEDEATEETTTADEDEGLEEVEAYDATKGEGKFDESNVKVGALDKAMAAKGEAIAASKCISCHKVTTERLVGPGWKGVTERRKPYWIMNFITNPDPMIDKDPEVKAQMEQCLVRMPNQSLAETEAREILEYMRKNDGVK
ncbi:MAG: c-type cytochrome [Saprospiraceae bacterium]|jgi:mono/diheme cytochrome c family protein|uniref:c-type cytochrome n=1 Tax=Candidatus Brachybacter algidus TaxID=2982024 RepID=UPI001B5B9B72|nr:c-type cytochrome [Candidatus Brachybacter algidus]MBP7305488.1 c-type cytochrome [Saprospiraceae bacterium]MBK6372567.1 c-type cytochrome [Candidatus Brachybacter algidus]MBK6448455.1 c-type cytochrome [Candidatus Brachybacter algidus]MBK7603948.1 c-type cytochrome [Candidatus Brachybacter algidus]MBK8354059.1 c-type cytochrome [Candidatus Brachybacter algidus]